MEKHSQTIILLAITFGFFLASSGGGGGGSNTYQEASGMLGAYIDPLATRDNEGTII